MATTQPTTHQTHPTLQQALRSLSVLGQPLVLAGIAANVGAIAMAVLHGA